MNLLEHQLKSENLRVTEARKVLYDILDNSSQALSAQEICKKMKSKPGLKTDQASIYRNLTVFTKIGLTHSLSNGKYVACQHNIEKKHQHTHIVANCSVCGKTLEFKNHNKNHCQVANNIKNLVGGFETFTTMTLEGCCTRCASSQKK